MVNLYWTRSSLYWIKVLYHPLFVDVHVKGLVTRPPSVISYLYRYSRGSCRGCWGRSDTRDRKRRDADWWHERSPGNKGQISVQKSITILKRTNVYHIYRCLHVTFLWFSTFDVVYFVVNCPYIVEEMITPIIIVNLKCCTIMKDEQACTCSILKSSILALHVHLINTLSYSY